MALPNIGLSGKAGSGKDTVADYLVKNYGYTKVSFAGALKQMALALNPVIGMRDGVGVRLAELVAEEGMDKAKRPHDENCVNKDCWRCHPAPGFEKTHDEVRGFLQRLGTDAVRAYDDQFWIRTALTVAKEHEPWVITDARFDNEAQAVKDNGGIMWQVVRDGAGAVRAHVSENPISAHLVDEIIFNNHNYNSLFAEVIRALEFTDNPSWFAGQENYNLNKR